MLFSYGMIHKKRQNFGKVLALSDVIDVLYCGQGKSEPQEEKGSTMQRAEGKGISDGIVIGRIRIFKSAGYEIDTSFISDPEAEIKRWMYALKKAIVKKNALYEKTLAEVGAEDAQIFAVQVMMLEDVELQDAVRELITVEKRSADYAVDVVFNQYAQMFEQMEDAYLQAKSIDMLDIKKDVLQAMAGEAEQDILWSEPVILVAEDLLPSDTVKLDRSLLLGFVTRQGSGNSHTAILARSLHLPAMVQCKEIDDGWDGKVGILDSKHSILYVEPTQELVAEYTAQAEEAKWCRERIQILRGERSVTKDGTEIRICANITGPDDVGMAIENDAQGIGLFRSEFLYLGRKTEPSEEEQYQIYRQVAEAMAPQRVVVRTCDLGTDKMVDYLGIEKEENPALGMRAIRISLSKEEFFKRQLRAILRASTHGNLAILFPMIVSEKELESAKQLLQTCKEELVREGFCVGNYQVGIMVETPAAVLCAEELAKKCDFFSIGTNDLTQYLLAMDRQNDGLSAFYDVHHPAVLKAIQMTVEAAQRNGIRVGICGELGADATLTETFLRMGIDELSVNPSAVLPVRKVVRELDLAIPARNDLLS